MLNPAPSVASGSLFDIRPRPSLTCEEAATLARVRGGRARLEAMERCEASVVSGTGVRFDQRRPDPWGALMVIRIIGATMTCTLVPPWRPYRADVRRRPMSTWGDGFPQLSASTAARIVGTSVREV